MKINLYPISVSRWKLLVRFCDFRHPRRLVREPTQDLPNGFKWASQLVSYLQLYHLFFPWRLHYSFQITPLFLLISFPCNNPSQKVYHFSTAQSASDPNSRLNLLANALRWADSIATTWATGAALDFGLNGAARCQVWCPFFIRENSSHSSCSGRVVSAHISPSCTFVGFFLFFVELPHALKQCLRSLRTGSLGDAHFRYSATCDDSIQLSRIQTYSFFFDARMVKMLVKCTTN